MKRNKESKSEKKNGILGSFKLLWHFMGRKEKFTFVSIFVLSIFAALTQTYCALLPALIIARFSGENLTFLKFLNFPGVSNVMYIFITCAIAVLLWVVGMLIYRMIDIFGRRMMCVVNERVQNIILLERKNLDFGMTVGETNYILKNAVDNIYQIIEPFCWRFCTNIISVIQMIVQLFLLSYVVGLAAIGLILMILIGVFIRTKLQESVVERIESTNARIGNHFLQSLTNLPMITIFESKKRELDELKKLNDGFFKDNKKRANIGFWYWVIIIAIEYLGLFGLVAIYVSMSQTANVIASVTIIVNEILTIYSMVENWGYLISDMQVASIKFCNLKKIYPKGYNFGAKSDEIVCDSTTEKSPKRKDIDVESGEEFKIKTIDVSNLTVEFGSFKKTYDITFESGKVYLISGSSGQGKTTLVNAICGLRDSKSGTVLVNKKYKMKSLYNYKNHISYLFQDSILFDRSVAENIAYPDLEISERAEQYVKELGMQKIVERETHTSVSSALSGGEKKRIDFIRTISKDKDIYFFDEPTNELDSKNVNKVLEMIKKLGQEDKIVILISHDERCLKIADQIVEL